MASDFNKISYQICVYSFGRKPQGPQGPQGPAVPIDSALSATSENAVQNKVVKTALDTKADDNAVVKLTGGQTIGGGKHFTNQIRVPTIIASDATANNGISIYGGSQYGDGGRVQIFGKNYTDPAFAGGIRIGCTNEDEGTHNLTIVNGKFSLDSTLEVKGSPFAFAVMPKKTGVSVAIGSWVRITSPSWFMVSGTSTAQNATISVQLSSANSVIDFRDSRVAGAANVRCGIMIPVQAGWSVYVTITDGDFKDLSCVACPCEANY